MKKEKIVYRFIPYVGNVIHAKKEIPFEITFTSRLILDEICFKQNKKLLEDAINHAIEHDNKELFRQLSNDYKQYIWE